RAPRSGARRRTGSRSTSSSRAFKGVLWNKRLLSPLAGFCVSPPRPPGGGGGTGEPRRWVPRLRELSVDRLRQPRSQLGVTGIADGSPLGDNALDLALARPREALPVLVTPGAEAAAQVASALPKHHQIMAPKRAVFALLPWPG